MSHVSETVMALSQMSARTNSLPLLEKQSYVYPDH